MVVDDLMDSMYSKLDQCSHGVADPVPLSMEYVWDRDSIKSVPPRSIFSYVVMEIFFYCTLIIFLVPMMDNAMQQYLVLLSCWSPWCPHL